MFISESVFRSLYGNLGHTINWKIDSRYNKKEQKNLEINWFEWEFDRSRNKNQNIYMCNLLIVFFLSFFFIIYSSFNGSAHADQIKLRNFATK